MTRLDFVFYLENVKFLQLVFELNMGFYEIE